MRDWPTSAAVFLPNVRPLAVGELLVQKDLATTFRRLVEVERANAARGRGDRLPARDHGSFPESFFPHDSLPGVPQVEARFSEDSRAALERLGHRIRVMPDFWRGACTVCAVRRLDTGALEGGADPRRDAAAAGW